MKRIHQLSDSEIVTIQKARMEAGRQKYGDAHLQRYLALDAFEEILDAFNILNLLWERIEKIHPARRSAIDCIMAQVKYSLIETGLLLQALDYLLPDEFCTDEKGGERIGFDKV